MSEQDNAPRAGTGLFEKVAGCAKATIGRLLGNDDLAAEGALQQAKAETAEDAAHLMAEAEQREREAELAAEQEANRIERQRIEAELSNTEREEQIRREHRDEDADIERRVSRARAAVADRAEREEELIEQREREVTATYLEGAVEAAAVMQEAKQAEATADVLGAVQRDLENEQNGESS
jgi:uncharacterized protein YjbJ (UPF0337 family)